MLTAAHACVKWHANINAINGSVSRFFMNTAKASSGASKEPVEFASWMQARVEHVEGVLDARLPRNSVVPERLHDAMRYAVLGGGKRVRACLVYAAGEAAGKIGRASCREIAWT